MSEAEAVRRRMLVHVCCGPCVVLPLLDNCGDGNTKKPSFYNCGDGNTKKPLLDNYSDGIRRFHESVDNLCNGINNGWRDFDITGLFYNPNIHPIDEFQKRLSGAKEVFACANRRLIINDKFMQNEWEIFENTCKGCDAAEKKRARCEMCYRTRLAYTAEFARNSDYDAFSTSLLISPYQDHELIAAICEEQSKLFQIEFFYIDWRPFFREGQKLARELGLYRQKYCGCIFSLAS